jgi:4a-hydroxytetrahydrobiopterin dehydratase
LWRYLRDIIGEKVLDNREIQKMEPLSKQKCIPCEGNLPPASEAEIAELKPQIPDWNIITENGEKRLQRAYHFDDFQTAMAFSVAVGEEAEKEGHHPVLTTEWGKVTVTWWTHAINGLHRNDFIMATRTDEIYPQFSG